MTKNNKNWNPEESVQNFFESAKGEFTSAEFTIIKEGYECLRQVVVPNMYSEVAMAIITVIYSRRKNNKEELLTLDKVLNEVIDSNESLFEEALTQVSPSRIRELNFEDALSNKKDSLDEALASTIDVLLDSEDLGIQIFLDMSVRGKTAEDVAKLRKISVEKVNELYTTARDVVRNMMVVDHDVLIQEDATGKGAKN